MKYLLAIFQNLFSGGLALTNGSHQCINLGPLFLRVAFLGAAFLGAPLRYDPSHPVRAFGCGKALALALCFTATLAHGQSHSETLRDYLTEDVVAVAYLDLSKIDAIGALEWGEKLGEEFGLGPEVEQRAQAMRLMLNVQGRLDEATDFGARYVYSLFRVSDIRHGGPTWVIPVSKQGSPRAVLGMLLSGRPDRFEIEQDTRPDFFPDHCEAVSNVVLGANSPEQLEMLKSTRPTDQRDLDDAWDSLGGGHCGLIIFGDKDSRRVVREMFPKLPAPFGGIDGRLIADQLRWGGVVADLPPEPSLQIVIQADENSTANIVQSSINDGLSILKESPFARQFLDESDRDALAAQLSPEVVDGQLAITFKELIRDIDRIARVLGPPVLKVRQDAARRARMNQFKQIALAMLNYESANGTLPPRCTFDQNGRPLLSWRVHILPYLEQQELYHQFHLDEPWDSEHNKQLIPLMPSIYADPGPSRELRERNAKGHTTFLMPTGPGTISENPDGTLFKDLIDGTSNTLLVVEVAPMSCPVWTKPEDWMVNPERPKDGLQREDRDWFTTVFCDGHVEIVPLSTRGETIRAVTTIAGEETIEYPIK